MQQICLSFDEIRLTSIELENGEWIEEAEQLIEHKFSGTEEMDSEALTKFVATNIGLEFDGDLDEPELFEKVTATSIYGPGYAAYDDDGMVVSDISIYLEVSSTEELEEDQLEDLFHVVVPIITADEMTYRFTEFESYEAIFEDAPEEGKRVSVTL